MSEQTPEDTTPSLPLEVWLNIFDFATVVPNAFNTSDSYASPYSAPMSQDQIQEGIRASLCTRHRIALVCRRWNSYATHLLYQAILITRYNTVGKILRTLTDSDTNPAGITGNGKSKGRLAVRLDVILTRESFLPTESFVELLRRLPKLQIVVFRGRFQAFTRDNSEFKSFFDVLAIRTIPTLKVFDFHSFDSPHTTSSLDVINGLRLRVLRIRPLSLSLQSETTVDLPKIEYLDVPPQLLRLFLTGDIRNLHLRVDGHRWVFQCRLWAIRACNQANFRHLSRALTMFGKNGPGGEMMI